MADFPSVWSKTHSLTFTSGDSRRAKSWTVMLCGALTPSGWQSAYTEGEWTGARSARWTVDPQGTWHLSGKPTPQGERGSLRVDARDPESR